MTHPGSDTAPPTATSCTGPEATDRPAAAEPREAPRVRSMHEGTAVWDGCGSCGAEPYWLELATETGMTLGTNSHDGDHP